MSQPIAAAPFPLLPRSPVRRTLVVAAAYLALTLGFVITGFPVDRLTPQVEALASAAIGSQVDVGKLDLDLVALLPALHAREVAITTPGGQALRLDRVRARPAWSFSWLRGDPSLMVALRAGDGRVDGTVRLGGTPGFRGDFAELDLALLGQVLAGSPGLAFDGRVGGELDLRIGELGPEGALALHAAEGSLSLPDFPIGLPYQSIDAEATLGGDALATIESLVVDGPMLALDATGTVGHGAAPGLSPLALQARLDVREPALRDLVAGAGVALGPDGRADLTIGGTLGEPQLGPGRGAPGARGARMPGARRP